MFTLYVDESGDWGYPNYNPIYPVLCLCGSIVLDDYYLKEIMPAVANIKRTYLHKLDLTIRRHDLSKAKDKFTILKDEAHAKAFIVEFTKTIAQFDMKIIISSLDKVEYYRAYGTGRVDSSLPTDIYSLLLTFMIERFFCFLWEKDKAKGRIVVESRGTKEDNIVQQCYSRIMQYGTQFYTNPWQFQKVLPTSIEFKQKKDNIVGLQLSDWIAMPIAKKILFPDGSQDPFGEWELYKGKIWLGNNPSSPGQVGFKTFPNNLGRKLLNQPLKSPGGV